MSNDQIATIKKPNEIEYITKEEYDFRLKEIARCKRDIVYFAEKYFKIINLDKGLMTIKLYPKQKELLNFLLNEDRSVVIASRQSSKTTTYTIFALWYTMFFPEKKIMLLCNKADTSIEVCSRIQLGYMYLPPFLKCSVETWNKGEIIFSNHSAIKAFPCASDSARGFSANCVNKNSIITIRSRYIKWLTLKIKIKHLVTIARIQNFILNSMNRISRLFQR